METFSRSSVIELIDAFDFRTHASIENFALRFALEDVVDLAGGVEPKITALKKYLISTPAAKGPNGASLVYEIVECLLQERLAPRTQWDTEFRDAEEVFPKFAHALARDGFLIEDAELRPVSPEELETGAVESRLELLLDHYLFTTAKGHLGQARSAYVRGEWAAANGQLRTFVEALFIAMADRLGSPKLTSGHAAMNFLASLPNPIIDPALNEWESNGKGFMEGFWKRLHTNGSHPGLSDQDDATFRLRLVLVSVGHYLELFSQRVV